MGSYAQGGFMGLGEVQMGSMRLFPQGSDDKDLDPNYAETWENNIKPISNACKNKT